MKFRPCIDLHQGKVKQIVGSTLSEQGAAQVNFEAHQSPGYFAQLYRSDGLTGGHVIQLGPGNAAAARDAIAAYPGGLQIGGGITADTAQTWLDAGAAAVIVTSYIFHGGAVDWQRLEQLADRIGVGNLVLDVSCRRRAGRYYVVADRWQTFTDVAVDAEGMTALAHYCAEFLVHAVDVEGKQGGFDQDLVALLASFDTKPITYAGGVRDLADLQRLNTLGKGKIDVTIGSALDIFGGTLAYRDVVDYCRH